jgi:hypothetical protein
MLENIMETTIVGSNTVYLNIPEEDYFLSYETVTREAANEITNMYFLMRAREGRPEVKDIVFDEPSHRVRITLAVDLEDNKYTDLEGYSVPDTLNITRNNAD